MTQPDVGPESRLYAMMQHLMVLAANGKIPEPAPPRNVVTRDEALAAVLGLAAVIDAEVEFSRFEVRPCQLASLPDGLMPDGA
jgi:hypothetical protein